MVKKIVEKDVSSYNNVVVGVEHMHTLFLEIYIVLVHSANIPISGNL